MRLLQEGMASGAVVKTSLTRKLTLDGTTQVFPVYRVRLDLLFYNEQNGRIATWISQYKNTHIGEIYQPSSSEAYNAIIEEFIVKSNPEAIRKTQTNIELVDQREPGVVLNDGRVIDGNRRFTCLRNLAKKSERFNGFETIILERDIENSAKQIKMLELSIQHGEEKKIEYTPVDILVGVYHDIEETALLSTAEYARSANITEAQVKERLEVAKLLVDFLDFINAPKQYYIARDLEIASPMEELNKMLKKCATSDEAEDLKICVFSNLLMQTSADQTRYIRNVKAIAASEYRDSYISEQLDIAAKVVESLPPKGKMNGQVIREVLRANDEIKQELERSMEKAIDKTKKKETRNFPIRQLERATSFLEAVDVNIFLKMNDSELRRADHQLRLLEAVVADIRRNML